MQPIRPRSQEAENFINERQAFFPTPRYVKGQTGQPGLYEFRTSPGIIFTTDSDAACVLDPSEAAARGWPLTGPL